MSIGIFDSGVGGLTVAKEIIKMLPNETIIYFGDTKNAPYGGKSDEEIFQLSYKIVEFLQNENVEAIVIACNTICVCCFDKLQDAFDIPIIGMIDAGVSEVLKTAKKNVAILATEFTINSNIHKKKLEIRNPELKIFPKACPLFVPLIESGQSKEELANETAFLQLSELQDENIDTVLLACTHYPIMIESIQRVFPNANVLDPAKMVASELISVLASEREPKIGQNVFFASGDIEVFNKIALSALGMNVDAKLKEL